MCMLFAFVLEWVYGGDPVLTGLTCIWFLGRVGGVQQGGALLGGVDASGPEEDCSQPLAQGRSWVHGEDLNLGSWVRVSTFSGS